ncbi:MAG: nitrogenase iron-molybdenum cofactor biosynthesis protein NifN [Stellaceae bacterium]
MAKIETSTKICTVNPLKMSQPIGGALAFMGVKGSMPLLHGSQGCTSFGLVLFVRHFRESIPLQTTAMNEVATVLGGLENVEQAIMTIATKSKPALIGICSTGVTETKGDDVDGYIRLIRTKHPEIADIALVYVSTPDFKDAFQDGWAKAVTRMVEQLVAASSPEAPRNPQRINVLPGCHLTPGDIEELREIFDAFGLEATVLPDLSGSLDGHVPADFSPTTTGGVSVEEIAAMGKSSWTIAIGEQMRDAATALEQKTGVPFTLFDRLTGLTPNDELMGFLARISGRPVPDKLRRQRSQLVDAMLDGHFFFGGKRIAIGAEPDLLWSIGSWLAEMGCDIAVAVTTTQSPLLGKVPAEEVLIGDLEDLENRAASCDLLVTHSHGRQAAERLAIPFCRMGLPIFDRLGAGHRLSVGYRGTRNLIFEIGNMFMAEGHEPNPDTWRITDGEPGHARAPASAH